MGAELLIFVAAVVVGAALASTGAVLQSSLRNPLAEPYMLGIVGGAALFAAGAIQLGWATWATLPAFAFAGACASLGMVCLVTALAVRRLGGRVRGETVILAGFATGSFTGSLEMVVLMQAEPETFTRLSKWLFGDLHAVTAPMLGIATLLALVAMVAMYSQNRNLNALLLGDAAAESLGVKVRRTLFIVLGAASLATAASVSLAGAIGFVGLVVPHAVRRLVGVNHRAYLPLSALGGAVALVVADQVGRFFPQGASVGVVCAVVGAPFFLYLLILGKRRC